LSKDSIEEKKQVIQDPGHGGEYVAQRKKKKVILQQLWKSRFDEIDV
jgi:hypothetical protein